MSEPFDAYQKWLGIPPRHQPPHHYRLLGLEPFEDDPDSIAHAADRQMAHVRTFHYGEWTGLSEELLRQLAAARFCLLDPSRKAAYDAQLHEALSLPSADDVPLNLVPDDDPRLMPAIGETANSPAIDVGEPRREAKTGSAPPRRRRKNPLAETAKIVLGGIAGLAIAVGILWYGMGRDPFGLMASLDEHRTELTGVESNTPANDSPNDDESFDARRGGQGLPPVGPMPTPGQNDTPPGSTGAVAGEEQSPDKPDGPLVDAGKQGGLPQAGDVTPDAAPMPPVAATTGPWSIPDNAALEQAAVLMRDVFQQEIAAAETPQQKSDLAKMLLEQATSLNDDPAARFVMLRAAMKLALGCGDYALAMQVVDRLASSFDVDALRLRSDVLSTAARAKMTVAMRAELVVSLLDLSGAAARVRRYNDATRLADLAVEQSLRVSHADLRRHARLMAADVKRRGRVWAAVEGAIETLQSNPDDPAANLLYGKYRCLTLGDWEGGLPLLAKGSDQALGQVADLDLTRPAEIAAQVEIADAWYNLAQSHKLLLGFHARTYYWYAKVAPTASGLTRTKADKRLSETAAIAAAAPVFDPNRDQTAP